MTKMQACVGQTLLLLAAILFAPFGAIAQEQARVAQGKIIVAQLAVKANGRIAGKRRGAGRRAARRGVRRAQRQARRRARRAQRQVGQRGLRARRRAGNQARRGVQRRARRVVIGRPRGRQAKRPRNLTRRQGKARLRRAQRQQVRRLESRSARRQRGRQGTRQVLRLPRNGDQIDHQLRRKSEQRRRKVISGRRKGQGERNLRPARQGARAATRPTEARRDGQNRRRRAGLRRRGDRTMTNVRRQRRTGEQRRRRLQNARRMGLGRPVAGSARLDRQVARLPAEGRRAGPNRRPRAGSGRRGERAMASVRQKRRLRRERGGRRVVIDEPGHRRIVRQGRRAIIRHNDMRRLRRGGRRYSERRRGGRLIGTIHGRDGSKIITEWDKRGRMIRRYRRGRKGRVIFLIDNRPRYARHYYHDYHDYDDSLYYLGLPAPIVTIGEPDYIVDADYASADDFYDTFAAPPIRPIPRRYTLDEVRYNYPLRAHMRSVNLTVVHFDTASWHIDEYSHDRLADVADAMCRIINKNPQEIFLIEGHTDAVGPSDDNLSLSDRRAEAVAVMLTEEFGIPPENLVTQGYGEQHLLVRTSGPARKNRRVIVRRITPLISQGYE